MTCYLIFLFRGRVVRLIEMDTEGQMNRWLDHWIGELCRRSVARLDSGEAYDDVQAHKELV